MARFGCHVLLLQFLSFFPTFAVEETRHRVFVLWDLIVVQIKNGLCFQMDGTHIVT